MIAVFCETCAEQGIQGLPPSSFLTISVLRTGEEVQKPIRRRYQVLNLDEASNWAAVKTLYDDNQVPLDVKLTIRSDMIPQQARAVGESFEIGGTPLEISLFERSRGALATGTR